MIERRYYCDWCGKEMSKLFYFTGSHLIIAGRFSYDEDAASENEDCICKECYADYKELRRRKKENKR